MILLRSFTKHSGEKFSESKRVFSERLIYIHCAKCYMPKAGMANPQLIPAFGPFIKLLHSRSYDLCSFIKT